MRLLVQGTAGLEHGSHVSRRWARLRPRRPPERAETSTDEAPPARGYWVIVWRRFGRDRVAVASAVLLLGILLGCFAGEPLAARLLGHGPNDIFPMAVDIDRNLLPAGPWSHVPNTHTVLVVTPHTPRTLFILGAADINGHDLFLRVLDGGRTSLELALGATALALALGTALGMLSGYFGGWPDAFVSRLTELIMGFPFLLFLISIGWVVSERLSHITLGDRVAPGVVPLVLIVGGFYCFYPARLVRAQVLMLRQQEFVEAALVTGASDFRIMRKHLFPHVAGSLVVYATQLMAITIFLEAALSILGVGIQLPYATWGNIIAANYGTLLSSPLQHSGETSFIRTSYLIALWPSLLMFLTVVAFTLVGEGVRNAVDPRAVRR